MPAELHLLRPLWLLALLPLTGLLWLWWRNRGSGGDWQRICDPALLPHLLIRGAAAAPRWPLLLIGLGGALGILALAGPVWQKLDQPVFRETSALVVALDLSRSMDSTDLAPSRVVRARLKLLDILKRRREGQTALLVFADQAFAVTPLSDDTDTIASLAGALETGLMPGQGSRPDRALEKGRELLIQAGARQGHVLLVTDSPGDQRTNQVIAMLREDGHRVHVLGAGTPEGAPIPVTGGGFLKDIKGAIVIPRLDEPALDRMAQAGGGRYARLGVDNRDLDYLLQGMETRQIEQEAERADLRVERWREEGPWLLLLLLPLAALAFRRGYLGLAVVLLLPLPDPAQAVDWQGLWQRPDQQAVELLQAGEATAAAERFTDPRWKAAAHYRAEDYEQALAALDSLEDSLEDPDVLYNKGNALARAGRLGEALEAYDQALTQVPEHPDAAYNRKLVEEALKQQQQQQSQQGEQDQDSDQDKDQSETQDNESQQGQQDQQQQGDPEQEQQRQSGSDSQEESAQDQDAETQAGQPPEEAESEKQEAESTAEPQDSGEQQEQPQPQATEDQEPQAAVEPSAAEAQQTGDSDPETAEIDQATRQWLRRIPDDPAGLLRRKFRYQYRQLAAPRPESERW